MGEAQLDAVAARSDLLRQEYGILAQLAFEQHDRTSDHSSSFLMASSIMLSAVTLFVKEPKDPADIAGVAWVAGLSGLALCSMWFLTMSRIRNEVNYWYDQLRDREAQLGRAQDGIFSRGKRELQEPGGFRVIHAVALLPVVFSLLYAALIGWKGGPGVWPWAASAGIWFGVVVLSVVAWQWVHLRRFWRSVRGWAADSVSLHRVFAGLSNVFSGLSRMCDGLARRSARR